MDKDTDVDIANVINNFMIEAAALLSALRGTAELQQQQITELQNMERRIESLQLSIRDQAQRGVNVKITPALDHLERIGAKASESIALAAHKATSAVNLSLHRVETAKIGGFWRAIGVAVLASCLTFILIAACLPWAEIFLRSLHGS